MRSLIIYQPIYFFQFDKIKSKPMGVTKVVTTATITMAEKNSTISELTKLSLDKPALKAIPTFMAIPIAHGSH
ncbi:MAG: hypothetical protein CMP91_05945 [Gammaproteobacteria bacterium]|nr:hypothetical protein [Gammaproteobacteria bacterium]MAY02895.1 hypothetical protein [Gammaproteobacteria bacterium]|tara:strand:+ start:3268 stop:3486 length:219 start_codon:yes stop_codon:yes gene_type:complete